MPLPGGCRKEAGMIAWLGAILLVASRPGATKHCATEQRLFRFARYVDRSGGQGRRPLPAAGEILLTSRWSRE